MLICSAVVCFTALGAHIFYANLAAAYICKQMLIMASVVLMLKANTVLGAAVRSWCHNETRLTRFRSHVQKHVVWLYNYTAIINKLRSAHRCFLVLSTVFQIEILISFSDMQLHLNFTLYL